MSTFLTRNEINKDFSRNPSMEHPRSMFQLPNKRCHTMNGSYLIPIYFQETVPGDTWEINMSIFARLMPQVSAVMDKVMMKTYFFWERGENLWEHFPNMIGARKNPNDSIDYTVPAITIPVGGFKVGSLYDYMTVPINRGAGRKISALPFRMYNRIWNKYFRSEQLQDEVTEKNDDSDDDPGIYTLLKKNKTPDYFTRNLVNTQLGNTGAVNIPLGTQAPVVGNGKALGIVTNGNTASNRPLMFGHFYNGESTYFNAMTYATSTLANNEANFALDTTQRGIQLQGPSTQDKGWNVGVSRDKKFSGLVAQLNEAASASVIAFRNAMAMQRTLEMDNRCGTRYTEILQGRYGVTVPDAFLNRPVYVGGTAEAMTTIPITQTSSTDATTPQGNLSGNTSVADGGQISFSVPDFGYIMGLVCISVEPQYQQGLRKLFNRFSRYDFYHPEFNGIGDQATYNYELFLQDENVVNDEGTPINDEPFGYNERDSEYKTAINEVCGYMRSEAPLTLDSWGYWEKFENLPTLNSTFIQDKAEECIKRTLAVQELEDPDNPNNKINAPQCLFDGRFEANVYRGIPVYNIPSIQNL